MESFPATDFLPCGVKARLTQIRVEDPDYPIRAAQARLRRPKLTEDGKLNIVAADHPARGILGAAGDGLGMAGRHGYLARILRVLQSETIDGVMATMDVLEDLLTIHGLLSEGGGPRILDRKLLIASLNRGGLIGSAWEMDDPMTGPTPAVCAERRLDGTKILLRICDEEPGSLRTLLAAADAITAANRLGLPTFLEPLPVIRAERGYTVLKTPDALARTVAIASALGDSSRYLWLKLPWCDGYEMVAGATTLPILLLGGESAGAPEPFLRQVALGLAAGPNVRGALAGRNVLYPGIEDPMAVAGAAGGIIHQGWSIEEALESLAKQRGRDMDRLFRFL